MYCGLHDQELPNLKSKINHDSLGHFFGRNSFLPTHHPMTQRYVILPVTKGSQLQPQRDPWATHSFEVAKRAYRFFAHGIHCSVNADAGIGPTYNFLYFAPTIRIGPARQKPS